MPIFKVLAEELKTNTHKMFYFDSFSTKITEILPAKETAFVLADMRKFARKTGPFSTIKIQLGLSCNYSCSYCSQRYMKCAEETSKADIEVFLEKFDKLPKSDKLKVEFWGGEPLVYWETLKPLAEAIRFRHRDADLFMVTNGSLLTYEIVDWLVNLDFIVAVSHDGPGQYKRGGDPLKDKKGVIKYLFDKLLPKGRFSFNTVFNKDHYSRLEVIDFFEKEFPRTFLPSGEMGFITAHNENSLDSLDVEPEEHFEIRRRMWAEFRFPEKVGKHCSAQAMMCDNIARVNWENSDVPAVVNFCQRCGMDLCHNIVIDLKGNVLTCQNVSSAAIAPNGESHLIGAMDALEDVRLKTSTHWSQRPDCPNCPVISLCKGSCMFLEGDPWKVSCDFAYDDKITLLCIAFEQSTGYVPIKICAEHLSENRQWLWWPKGVVINKKSEER